jgi:hypothetical protein
MQFFSSVSLTWNNEFYDYEFYFRIWRYVSLLIAILSDVFYGDMIMAFAELLDF